RTDRYHSPGRARQRMPVRRGVPCAPYSLLVVDLCLQYSIRVSRPGAPDGIRRPCPYSCAPSSVAEILPYVRCVSLGSAQRAGEATTSRTSTDMYEKASNL